MKDPDVAFLREMIQRRQAFYEVSPYYIVLEERSNERAGSARRIQAGFDVDIYGVESLREPVRSSDYASGCSALEEIAQRVSQSSRSCSIEVVPCSSSLILDTRRNLQPQGMMRLRITRVGGLDQASGPEEEKALKAVLAEFHEVGMGSSPRPA